VGYDDETKKVWLQDSGVIRAPAKWHINLRLEKIYDDLKALFGDHVQIFNNKWLPGKEPGGYGSWLGQGDIKVVVEKYIVKNARGATAVAMADGIVRLICAKKGVHYEEAYISSIKKRVTGYGHSDKDGVRKAVKNLVAAPKSGTSDEYDAIAIALSALPGPLLDLQKKAPRRRTKDVDGIEYAEALTELT